MVTRIMTPHHDRDAKYTDHYKVGLARGQTLHPGARRRQPGDADGAGQPLQHAQETGIDPSFSEYVAGAFCRGVDAGLGHEDVAALIKVLRGGAWAT